MISAQNKFATAHTVNSVPGNNNTAVNRRQRLHIMCYSLLDDWTL